MSFSLATPSTYAPTWSSVDQHPAGLHITVPQTTPFTANAYALKLTFAGPIPALR